MQELSPEMSEKGRMTSVFTAASGTVLLSEKTDRLKLEMPDAMSQQPKSYREQWRLLRFNTSTEWCTSQSCNRGRYPDAGKTVHTTVELRQVHFLDKGVDIHVEGGARTSVRLLDADALRKSTLICPIRQEGGGRTLRSRGDSHRTSQCQNRGVGGPVTSRQAVERSKHDEPT